jgi:3-oxoacyl-[acyl-carrier protein] reductase
MYNLKGQTALITGAAQGIGRAIALELARSGASIALNDLNETVGEQTVAEALAAGAPKAKFYKFDVSRSAVCNEAVKTIVAEFGGVQILVNNAGISIDALLVLLKDRRAA